jgi:hypothetical protein
MDRRALAPAFALPTLVAWICACTGGPLPNTTDALAEDETGGSTSEGEVPSESETSSTEVGSDDTTTTDDPTDDPTTGNPTTGDDCMTPAVVGNLTINADTPPEGLACLREVYTRLVFKVVDWVDLAYLPALERVGQLEIRSNPALTNLSGTSLVELDRLSLSELPALTSTTGLEQLVTLEDVYLSGLPSLVTVDLPIGLPTASIDVSTSDLDALAQLQPQPSGATFDVTIGSLTADIAGLMSCCAMPELNLTTYSEVLIDFTDLQGITTMSELHVFNAGQLIGFAGLEQLESIGTLEIAGDKCDILPGWLDQAFHITSLAGLDGLSAIDTLKVRYLFELQTLAGLPADTTITALELRNMPALSYAEAEAFAIAVQAENTYICGLAGDALCYIDLIEAAPCPQ